MGRNKRQGKSFFSMFVACCTSGSGDDTWDDGVYTRRVCPSEEDTGRWRTAEPGIDRKASAFIAKFYETRVSNTDHVFE
ncbi:hypothetical protein LguiA_000894 [Lonicera macranthoides]